MNKYKRAFNLLWTVFVTDFPSIWFYLKQGKFKKLYSFIWCRLLVRDVGGGLLDFFWRKNASLKKSPSEVEVEITTKCHLQCLMCEHTHWDEKRYTKQQISIGDFKKIVEGFGGKLKYMGIQGMGTPFLNSDFDEIIKYCYEQNLYVNIVESFTFIKPHHLDAIMQYNVDRMDISMDAGTKETYEKIRVGANFEQTIENLKMLKAYKIKYNSPFPEVFWRFVAFDLNKHEIPEFLKIVMDLDINMGHPTNIEIAGLLAFDKIKDLDTAPIDLELINRANEMLKGTHYNLSWNHTSNFEGTIDGCVKWVQPFIMVNGDVVFDCALMMSDNRSWLHKYALGNSIREPMTQIWAQEEYTRERNAVNDVNAPIPKWCVDCRGVNSKDREHQCGIMAYQEDVFAEHGQYKAPDVDNIYQSCHC